MPQITRAQYLDKLLGREFVECDCQRGNPAPNQEDNPAPNQEGNGDFCLRCDVYKVKEALKYAHEIRQFEIELYWKRALYFWGFCLTLFGAYVLILTADIGDGESMNSLLSEGREYFLCLIALVGILISVAWYYIEKGSKAHMENWARHIGYLEKDVSGHLLKTIMGKKEDFFSPSRINKWIIKFISILWVFFLFMPHFDFATNVAKNIFVRLDIGDAIIILFFSIVGLLTLSLIIFCLLVKFFQRKWKTGDETIPDPEEGGIVGGRYDLHQRPTNDEV